MPRLLVPALAAVLGLGTALVPASAEAMPRRASVIAFISDRDTPPGSAQPLDQVYLYDTATGRTSRITDTPDGETAPVVSPSGRYLAYLRFDGVEFCRLRAMDDGWVCTATRRLVAVPPVSGRFAWSPDERSLVYAGQAEGQTDQDIFSVRLAGVGPARNLTDEAPGEPSVDEAQPTVSPDGRSIVYSRAGDLWRSRIGGGHAVQLTNTPAPVVEFGAEYSPDGKRLAFHSNSRTPSSPGTDDIDVYVARVRRDGALGPRRDLTSGLTASDGGPSRERYPSFSPDGKRLAFWWSVGGGQADLDSGEIYAVDIDGSDPVNLTANNPTEPGVPPVGDIFPDWGRPGADLLTLTARTVSL